jgi:uncharacterized protein (TIGR01777 family)
VRVVIAGGTGFLGTALAQSLRADGHDVTLLTRRPRAADQVAWNPSPEAVRRSSKGEVGSRPGTRPWLDAIDGADAVVNLAGESLDAGRWTAARKQRILESRLDATNAIVAAIHQVPRAPGVLVNASAIGIYGPLADQPLTETAPPADDFLASVCVAWERAARAAGSRTRVVLLRTGLVLDRRHGALPRLALPFYFFAGGPVGSGRQWWSWIHVADWVGLVRWAIAGDVAGPVNLTAPQPVTNREFATTLARVLGRPALLPAPGFALRALLGEMADALILGGQRVLPQRALDAGYTFEFAALEPALREIYRAG